MPNAQNFTEAWNAAAGASALGGFRSCGRAYVVIVEKADRAQARAWCKANRKIWTGAQGHVPNAIYVGYDNASGVELGRAEAFALELKARGVVAYMDAMGD